MSYKSIVVHVNESRHCADRVEIAVAIAARHEAYLTGVAISPLPAMVYLSGMEGDAPEALARHMESTKNIAFAALTAFEKRATQAGVTAIESRHIEGEVGASLCLEGYYCDLLVIGQNDPEETVVSQFAEVQDYVVMHSPSPVLIVPFAGQFTTPGKRIVVAWDASREARHAIAGAMPFLQQAERVQVVVFNPNHTPPQSGAAPGVHIARHLARHGVNVEVSVQTTATQNYMDIGNALLTDLADFQADLLVMGGYGHSTVREKIFGGVTRTMLKSMTVPVLMAH